MKSAIYHPAIFLISVSLLITPHDRTLINSNSGIPLTPPFYKSGMGISDNQSIESSDWYSTVTETIKKEEYNITYVDEMKAYQSPNRVQNLRFTYTADGFTAKPRTTKIPLFGQSDRMLREEEKQYRQIEDWQVKLRVAGYGRIVKSRVSCGTAQLKGFEGKELTVIQNKAFIEDQGLKIEYENNEEGMRQNFIVKEKPEGNGLLKLKINAESPLPMRVGPDAVVFVNTSSEEKMKYNSLKAWDSENKILAAHFEKESNNRFAIVVNDDNAVYPVTIDPLSTTANWTAESDQASAKFGCSVSTAGDVNGDSYSDIAIGAYTYDNGQTDEGRVFVYYGSSSGLSASANWTAESDQASSRFARSVSTAGDVNGDGYSDIVIGAYYYDNGQTDEGRVFVWYGSSTGLGASGTPTNAGWTAESNQANAYFGISVSTAGDVNGDGYSDIVIGAHLYDNDQIDEGRAFVYHGSASGLSASANWTAESDQMEAYFGHSVSTAGDVNGDGYSDIVIGASYYDNGQTDEGRAYVYHGSASGLSASANWTAESDQMEAYFGHSVSTAGDVNGDGYSDIMIAAPFYDNGQTNEGRVYVYHGSSSGLSTSANWTAESNLAESRFGISISTAGDVNGDGYSDVIIGIDDYAIGTPNKGRVYVYHGSSSGLSASPNWTVESDQSRAQFGTSVSTAGDVNGDGYSDIVIGAYHYDNGQTDEGRAYVYHGSSSGLSASANWTAESNQANAYFGMSVSTAGDVNGDCYSDIMIAAPFYDNGQTNEGRVYVYHGSSSGLSTSANWTAESNLAESRFGISISTAGDVNGDGYSDVIIGTDDYAIGTPNKGRVYVYHGSSSGLSASPNWTVESDQSRAQFGMSVSTAGDVNGDGYSDIVIGSFQYDNSQIDAGKVYVYHGSASGLSTTANWTAESDQMEAYFGHSVSTAGDVNGDGYCDIVIGAHLFNNGQAGEGGAFVYHGSSCGLSASADWTAESDQANAQFGVCVSTAGDVNGDGYSDIIIGADAFDNGQTNEGRVFVYHGSSSGLSTSANWTAESDQTSAEFGSSVSTAGDVNGDGYSDVIIGAQWYNNGQSYEGRAYVYYGSSSGLSVSANWTAESDQASAHFGRSVSTAGDVNGDGYSDVLVGAYLFDNPQPDEGRVYVYYGNNGSGLRSTLQQYQTGTSIIVGPHGKTGEDGQIRFNGFAKSSFGRADGKLVYEYVENGYPFGSIVNFSGQQLGYTDLGTTITGIELDEDVGGISPMMRYRWRERIKYSPVNNPHQVYGPWRYYTSYQPTSFGSFKHVHVITLSIPIVLSARWNLVSVPLVQSDWSASVIFPDKQGDMYSYDSCPRSYIVANILENGPGYWVNYSSSATVTFNGSPPTCLCISVDCAGWVLIGSREIPVDVSSLILSDGAVIYGPAYRYNPTVGIYEATTVINPGEGVWIFVSKVCTITIP